MTGEPLATTAQPLDTTAQPLKLGTRRSALARTQSRTVADAVTAATGRRVELVEITTQGDTDRAPLAQIGGTGVFVTALREALLAGRVDLAVHSAKDLPTAEAPGLVIAAYPLREDPRDALCHPGGLTLGELAPGSRIGTGSPRRAAQIHALGMGLDVVPIRGNVDTRLKAAIDGTVDAVVLARAGLARLDRLDAISETLDPIQMLPAPAQGALAIECRPGALADLLAVLDDPFTRAAVTAERALLATLEAGCSAPVGALGDVAEGDDGDELFLRAIVLSADGGDTVKLSKTGRVGDAAAVGVALATEMLEEGAAALMGSRTWGFSE